MLGYSPHSDFPGKAISNNLAVFSVAVERHSNTMRHAGSKLTVFCVEAFRLHDDGYQFYG